MLLKQMPFASPKIKRSNFIRLLIELRFARFWSGSFSLTAQASRAIERAEINGVRVCRKRRKSIKIVVGVKPGVWFLADKLCQY